MTEQIKRLQKNGSVEHEISIFWVPRRTLVSNKILEDEGVLGDANIFELPLLFLPLEEDVLSLEWEDAFPEIYLVGLYSRLWCYLAYSPPEKGSYRNFSSIKSFDDCSTTPRVLSTDTWQR